MRRAALAEHLVLHHRHDRALRFLNRRADQHALAQRQAIRLDHERRFGRVEVGKRLVLRRKRRGIRPWECRTFSSGSWRTPCCPRCARPPSPGRSRQSPPRAARRPRPGPADRPAPRPRNPRRSPSRRCTRPANIRCTFPGTTDRVLRDAAVAGQRVEFLDLRALFQRLDDRVLPSARADNQYLHILTSLEGNDREAAFLRKAPLELSRKVL